MASGARILLRLTVILRPAALVILLAIYFAPLATHGVRTVVARGPEAIAAAESLEAAVRLAPEDAGVHWQYGRALAALDAVLADSVQSMALRHGRLLTALEWIFTVLFTLEYAARLSCVERPLRYALSFYGVVDLIAILPTYLAALFPEAALLIDVRILRLLRIFRLFKLGAYVSEFAALYRALAASRRKMSPELRTNADSAD